ncbi:MAG: DNA mismatch repair protein MutS [Mycoplasma sp.]|nr:DNA mismatch repair protein MutS [Mycoplasma sp.]
MIIDLHGLTVVEATSETLMALLTFEEDNLEYELTIITGVGTGRVKNAITDLLNEEGYIYEIINNGSIRIKK